MIMLCSFSLRGTVLKTKSKNERQLNFLSSLRELFFGFQGLAFDRSAAFVVVIKGLES